ncbi:putative cucumisin-like [Capsicum annuum]|nr:putative cucumisin-like [Capsicum annuum]
MGRMGSPQASVRSVQIPKHAGGARCLPQSRRRHLRAYREPGLRPPLQSTLVHAPSRSADRLVAVPNSTGAHRQPPSTSLLGLGPGLPLRTRLQTTIQTTEPPNSKARVFPVHSPLLKKSWGMRAGDEAEVLVRSAIAPARVDSSVVKHVRGSFCCAGFDNNPSTGSHMETLLRLLLSLNDKVQWTSRNVAGSEPPTSPRSKHFTGSFNW